MIAVANAQPITEEMPEGQAELVAGLHQPKHAVARLPAVATDRTTRDLSLDDKPAQISFRGVCVQRRFGPFQDAQQLGLAALQPGQQFVEITIAGPDGENSVEPDLKVLGRSSAGSSRKVFQQLVKEPDEFAQSLDMFHLAGRRRHQLVQQALGMHPAQRMGADPELSGIVGDDHRIADQAMMANGAPDAGFGKWAEHVSVEDVDALFSQIFKKWNLIGKLPRFARVQPRQKRGIHLAILQKGEGGFVENVVLIATTQQGQKVQSRLRGRRAKACKMLAPDMRRIKIAVGMASTGVIDRDEGCRGQAGMQHGGILSMEAIQPLRQKPDDLAFGNLDTNIVEQRRQSLRCDLPMAVKHQAEALQVGAVATLDSGWQRRGDHPPIRRQPAFAAIAYHLGLYDQIPHDAILVALEARSGRSLGRQNLYTGDFARVAFGTAPTCGLPLLPTVLSLVAVSMPEGLNGGRGGRLFNRAISSRRSWLSSFSRVFSILS